MLQANSHQQLINWAGEKAAKAIVYVLLPVYCLSMYRNLIQQPDFLIAGFYTLLIAYFVALGWWRTVKSELRLLGVSLGIMAIALGVLLRHQDLGFALTFAVVASGIMPFMFDRRKAPYLAMLPLIALAVVALIGEVTEPMIIVIITGGSMAVVYILVATFCYVLEQTEEQRDIAEHALNTSLEKERLLDLSYTVMDLEVAELDVQSDRVRLIAGHSPNKALLDQGVSFRDFYDSVYGEGAAQKIRDLFNTPGRSLVLRANVNGEPDHWAKVGCTEEYQRDGKSYRSIYRIIVDELVSAKEQAEQHAKRNEILSTAGKAAITEMDFETGRARGNAEFFSRMGLPADTESVAIEEYFKCVREPVRSELPALAAQILNAAEGELLTFSHDFDAPDGSMRHYRVTATKAVREGRTYIDGVSIDVTDEVEAERLIEEQLEVIRSQRERQAQMYAVIGHELRTPAASLQMILDTQDENEELNRALIQANLQQLISVIDTLRAVAQPEKRVKGIYYDVLMDELLTQQLENFEPMAQQTKVRLHEDFKGLTVHPVRIQSTLVRQVVSNLIKNALIHSGASDITLQARAELLPERKKHLLIRVLDNGSGIPQETLKTLFKPFARGATHADGTGLGLYICKDLIENMGGTLRYLDNPGGGSCFEIDLTVDLADEIADEVTAEETSLLAGKRILLVEDNKTLQLLTEKLFTKQGALVVVANQGLEGLSHYQAGQFDLILSDIFMPEMNGYEFVSELRKRDCQQPIIGLTAATIGEETEQMLAAGADVVMSKPMNITEVSKWLANFSR